jgi:hypothetical protein
MSKAPANFTAADLKTLETAENKESAQTLLHAIVEKAGTGDYAIRPEKVAALHRNINLARSKTEVISIGWNMLLSGEKLSSINSKYQKRYA